MNLLRNGRVISALTCVMVACGSAPDSEDPFEIGLDLYRRSAYDSVLAVTARGLRAEHAPVERARLLTLEGLVHLQRADYEAAVARGESALELLGATGAESDRAWTHNLLGLVAYYESRFDDAIAYFTLVREAGTRARGRDAIVNLTRAAINLGLVYQDLGDFAQARKSFLHGLSLAREIGSRRLEGVALNALGTAMARSGLPHEAVSYLRDAQAAYREAGDPSREVNTLGQLGLAMIELGDFAGAEAVLDSAIQLARVYGMKQEEASNLSARAEAELRAGDFRKALATLAEAESLNVALDLPYELGMDLRSRAAIYQELGETELAVATADRAAVLHDSIGAGWAAFGNRLLAVKLAAAGGDVSRAEELLGQIRVRRDEFDTRAARVEFGLTAVDVALERDDPRSALRYLAEVESDVHDDQPGWSLRWGTLRARSWLAVGSADSAVAAARSAVHAVERIVGGLAEGGLRSHAISARVAPFVTLTKALLARGDTAEAFGIADRARGRHILEHRARTAAADPDRDDRLALAARIARMDQQILDYDCLAGQDWAMVDALWCAELETALSDLHKRLSELSEAPGRSYQTIIGREHAVDYMDVRNALGPGELLIEFLVGDEDITAFAVTASRLHARQLAITAEEVHRRVRVVRDVMASPGGNRDIQRRVLGGAYEDLIAPLLAGVDAAETLIFVPHGSLAYLPFAALITPRGQYLVQEANLLVIPSAAALVALRTEGEEKSELGTAAAIFAPLAQTLPATGDEVEAIGRVMRRADVFRGRRATKERFVEALASESIVHLATHGELRARNPMMSRLQFGGPGGDSQFLAVHEVIGLSVASRLVFLSGCETALGPASSTRYTAGEDYATLSQAFLYAGADNVVATLWRIDDQAAAVLAARFYGTFADTKDPVASLAEAQRHMIGEGQYESPYYWAAYQIAGRGTDQ